LRGFAGADAVSFYSFRISFVVCFSLLFSMGVLGSRMGEMLARAGAGGEGHIDTNTRFGRFRFVLVSPFLYYQRKKQASR
jgi:hypothetical protein